MTTNIKENKTTNKEVISETHRSDGSLATQIIRIGFDIYLIQYDSKNQAVFKEQFSSWGFSEKDITYHDGCVATIRKHSNLYPYNTTITQYDPNGHIVSEISVDKDDVVVFSNSGYLKSVTKHLKRFGDVNTIEEIEFDDNGHKTSSVQKIKQTNLFGPGRDKWLMTEAKQYHSNGKIQSVVTYAQRTKTEHSGSDFWNRTEEDEALVYISSITQYNESGELTISAQLKEYDDVNFNGNKIASITKRTPWGEILSQTTYYPTGMICSITQYANNKVVSSIIYDENGKPQSSAQQGTENYQDIYKQNTANQKTKLFLKAVMTPQQAAGVLGVSLNASEKEVKNAYHKLCKIWHPDRNHGNEEVAKRKMQEINEAYSVMLKYIKTRTQQQRPTPQSQNRPQQNPQQQQQSGDRSATFRAWIKLQDAIRNYDQAVERLKNATLEKERIANEYARTPGNDPKKLKLAQQLNRAQATWSCCVNNKLRAQLYKDMCEREYNRIRLHYANFQTKCYQRAA